MAVDSATTISAFDTAKPAGSDPASELDNNDRHIKTVLKFCFPNINATVNATSAELNYLVGVTGLVQTQLDAKATLASPTFTGTVTVPTATAGDNSTKAANTAFVATAISAVNATTGLTRSFTASTAFAVAAGQLIACTAAGAWAATFPPAPAVGTVCGVASQNNLATNTIDFGANSVMGSNGTAVSGVLTLDQVKPVYQFAWYGDYWREA